MEIPLYSIKEDVKSVVISQMIKVILLSLVFYGGVIINLKLLEIESSAANFLTIIVLVILIVLQTVLAYIKSSRKKYVFYSDKITKLKGTNVVKEIAYNQIRNVSISRNLFNKIFKTSTINIGSLKIQNIKNYNQIYNYIIQLIRSYQYNQYQYQQTQQQYQTTQQQNQYQGY